MTKNARQEITFVLAEASYTIRPTFAFISRLEGAMGVPARVLGARCLAAGGTLSLSGQVQEISLTDMALIIWAAVSGQKGAPESYDSVGEILMDDGYEDYLEPFGNMLASTLKGHKEHEPAKKAVGEVAAGAPDPSPQNPPIDQSA